MRKSTRSEIERWPPMHVLRRAWWHRRSIAKSAVTHGHQSWNASGKRIPCPCRAAGCSRRPRTCCAGSSRRIVGIDRRRAELSQFGCSTMFWLLSARAARQRRSSRFASCSAAHAHPRRTSRSGPCFDCRSLRLIGGGREGSSSSTCGATGSCGCRRTTYVHRRGEAARSSPRQRRPAELRPQLLMT